ncbi:biotin--[acetyl-CoA-carboxylase] ligase [Haloquadratum walsbyi]|jgi:birA, biotin-[acetyl-CoA-carboxylase] ligase region|uniref:biotin--[acetyl-CoA-carboxylase] ligase n=2 Tax=Haloquadratum walsbyi TaxID=293091 RepID=UPI0015F61896|nr:biotin--[acetyl-CoA-carboxylase] ligase [Haloquadratum walsbyi]
MNKTRSRLIEMLHDSSAPMSGPTLATRLNISRAAIWKHIEALRDAGFEIDSGPDGYYVASVTGYNGPAITFGLEASYRIEYADQYESTNDRARELAKMGTTDDVAVVADAQTGGRGRLDRQWSSPSGGIWVSLLLHPHCSPAELPVYTFAAAVAVVRAVQQCGIDVNIKWPNDVLLSRDTPEINPSDGRKIAGILTETAGEADQVSWLIVGIGLNANVDSTALPPEATSLQSVIGAVDRRALLQRLLNSFAELTNPIDLDNIIDAWRTHSTTLNQRVRITTPRETIEGVAVDIQTPGALIVQTNNGIKTIHAGDCEHLRSTEK